jgi:hypothetical protein
MSDLISRQAAVDIAPKLIVTLDGYEMHNQAVANYCVEITQLPPAQPERIRGRWISADAIFGGVPFYCSECGENTRDTVMGKPRWNFCPNCGAEMRGEHDG